MTNSSSSHSFPASTPEPPSATPSSDAIDAIDAHWMRKALLLARKGIGFTSPNPAVGAVIVRSGRLLGGGWHHRAGSPHAEINAIASLSHSDEARGATLYVTLEPCSTYGRTPPCCDAILKAGFARVVAGMTDPNPKHAGRAFQLLAEHGLETRCGVLETACRELNRGFLHWIQTGRPFVLLKLGETLDGKLATAGGSSQWITSPSARRRVARLRLEADAILAGAETFRLDNPSLTARTPGGRILKTPRRILFTRHPETLSIPADGTWETARADTPEEWAALLDRLGREQVLSVLIEGGGELAASALRAGVVDEVEFHLAPKLLGGRHSRSLGGPDPALISDAIELKDMKVWHLGPDLGLRAAVVRGKQPTGKD